MRAQLFFVFIHFTILTTNIILVTSQSSSLAETPLKKVDNETIYKVSKQLCWGCLGESLQFLFAHNLVRAAKWELPLMWDFQLEKYAGWWAGLRKADCKLQHSFPEYDFKLGENIYWGSGSTWTPTDAVGTWAGEEKYYNYAQNTCQEGQMCGHYTQIVWKTTRRIGCARVVCDDGDVFMTCNYDPPGEKPASSTHALIIGEYEKRLCRKSGTRFVARHKKSARHRLAILSFVMRLLGSLESPPSI
ncbi:hypothetical protein POPTR_018G096028v4 [Populus trichocarpa]|uniref:SCP domain-containing protein n=2 Tax=Populus trichocarpa TaxID=3694 RepID=A0A3N7G4L6_POPTR|nr:hypothetical protein POPTR_018G096028v4 [Populus trichocarpa]